MKKKYLTSFSPAIAGRGATCGDVATLPSSAAPPPLLGSRTPLAALSRFFAQQRGTRGLHRSPPSQPLVVETSGAHPAGTPEQFHLDDHRFRGSGGPYPLRNPKAHVVPLRSDSAVRNAGTQTLAQYPHKYCPSDLPTLRRPAAGARARAHPKIRHMQTAEQCVHTYGCVRQQSRPCLGAR